MLRLAIGVLAGLGVAQTGWAQESAAAEGWTLSVGGGSLIAPAYEGDDAYRLSALPSIQLGYGDVFFASIEQGVGYRWINAPTVRGGPIARLEFSRSEDGDQPFAVTGEDTSDLRGLEDVDTSVELGGFLEFDVGPLTLKAEARQGAGGHEGFIADFGAELSGRSLALGPPFIWSAGPRLRLVDATYNDAYFGVGAAQSEASGLPQYEPDGGVHSYGVGATAIFPLTRDAAWSAVLVAGYDRLAGDAAASPLVQERGSEDQVSFGLFVSRRLF